jgi:hypothetical protein
MLDWRTRVNRANPAGRSPRKPAEPVTYGERGCNLGAAKTPKEKGFASPVLTL